MKPFLGRSAAIALAAMASLSLAAPAPVHAQRQTAEPFVWEGPIPAGGSLEVKGVNGPIRAVAAPGGTARLTAVRSGRRDDPNEVEIAVVEHAGGVTICAIYPSSFLSSDNECLPGDEGHIGSRNNDVRVEFTVEVPAATDFVARTTNGEIRAEDLSGQVEARSTNGDVVIDGGAAVYARTTNGSVSIRSAGEADARTTNGEITANMLNLTGSNPLTFATTNGSITLGLPSTADLSVDASTTNGHISTDFPITVIGTIGRRHLSGTIGDGGREIRLRTTNGSISLEEES